MHAGALEHGDPIDELACARTFPEPLHLTQLVEGLNRLRNELLVEVRVMNVHDLPHQLRRRKGDEVEDAATEERIRKLLFRVACDQHNRSLPRNHFSLGLIDHEAHSIELVQQVVRKLDIRFVDFVDQEHDALVGIKRFANRTKLDVLLDRSDIFVLKPRIVEALNGIIDIKPILSAGRAFYVPADELHPEGFGDRLRQESFPCSRFSANKERAF